MGFLLRRERQLQQEARAVPSFIVPLGVAVKGQVQLVFIVRWAVWYDGGHFADRRIDLSGRILTFKRQQGYVRGYRLTVQRYKTYAISQP
jgi:hypothetical protein